MRLSFDWEKQVTLASKSKTQLKHPKEEERGDEGKKTKVSRRKRRRGSEDIKKAKENVPLFVKCWLAWRLNWSALALKSTVMSLTDGANPFPFSAGFDPSDPSDYLKFGNIQRIGYSGNPWSRGQQANL